MAIALGVAVLIDRAVIGTVIALFLIVAPFERLYPRRRQAIRRPLLGMDIAFALLSPVLNIVGLTAGVVIGVVSLGWLPGLLVRPVVDALPAVVMPFVAFVLFDLVSYWTHRFAHEVPFMWRFHAVHHSPEHMDWVSGFRLHPFDGVLIAPAFACVLAAGFEVEVAGVLAIAQVVLGLFFHANVRVRWRVLDRIVATPEFHHWHHSCEADAIGHNYGPALPWWDLLFGTYFMPSHRSGRRPAEYGVDEPLPGDVIGQLSYPCRGVRSHLWLWRHPVLALRALFAAVCNLSADIVRSTRRPTHSIRRSTVPGSASTNSSLIGPAATPRPPRRPLPERTA
ncbi:MAG: sterol desaturase family protein [Actinomycetota bacterium]